MDVSIRHLAMLPLLALLAIPAAANASPCPFMWERTLKVGMSGADVSALQAFFSISPTGYFGRLTERAVSDFQTAQGLPAVGVVGPRTRDTLNARCVAAPVAVSTSAVGAVAVPFSISRPEQPAEMIAPHSALYIPFTTFELAAGAEDVAVKTITVERIGPSQDQAFDYVSLLDEDGGEVAYGYLGADHRVVFRTSLTISAGETRTLTIAGNMVTDLSSYDGQVAGFAVAAIDASQPLSGVLPVSGTFQRIVSSLTIGSATMVRGGHDPAVARTQVFGDPMILSSVRVYADSVEDLRLDGITWRQSGTAGPHDVGSVYVYAGDVVALASADDRSYTAEFPGGIVIPKGQSIEIYVRATPLPGAANRSIRFDLQSSTDVWLTGLTYGYGIAPYPTGNTDVEGATSAFLTSDGTTDGDALTPYYAGSPVNVTSGAFNYIGR